MKKLLAIVLALVLVLGMGTVVFATVPESPEYNDESTITIKKELKIFNDGTVNPEETFNFEVGEGTGIRDGETITAPLFDPDTFTIDVEEGGTSGDVNIDLPDFEQVGVYTYPITEKAGNTAGFDYDGGTYNLVVTVINNPDYGKEVNGENDNRQFLRVLTLTDGNNVKDDSFTNSFSAGSLTIKKVITGNYADSKDEFTITVTVTPDDGKVINDSTITWYTEDVVKKVVGNKEVYTATYKLKGGDSATIENLPYDVSYTVVETDPGEYEVSYKMGDMGDTKIEDSATPIDFDASTQTITITNERNIGITTGINLDSLPYLIILAVAIGGLFLFVTRRRMASNE